VVEPHVDVLPPELQNIDKIQLVEIESALAKSDIIILLVDHSTFRSISESQRDGKTVIDTRGFWQ
jgi:UDP-N-acetyl-D-mannosaminuronic acid dehydrogenase